MPQPHTANDKLIQDVVSGLEMKNDVKLTHLHVPHIRKKLKYVISALYMTNECEKRSQDTQIMLETDISKMAIQRGDISVNELERQQFVVTNFNAKAENE